MSFPRAFTVCDDDGIPFSDRAYVRHLEAKVQSLQQLLALHGWQPIETAPKDCRAIIGLVWDGTVQPVWWSKANDKWQWSDGYHSGCTPRLTHWQPLPAPPARSRSGERPPAQP